jgi:L-aspartate oxidase
MPSSDFLVIGSGIAGLSFALKTAEQGTVAVITKKAETDSNTNLAQGGVAAVVGPDDDVRSHVEDTIRAGCGLSNPEAVEVMAAEGPDLVRQLFEMGVGFSLRPDGDFDLGQEGGHSHRRIVHARDYTGREIERVLVERVRAHPKIKILEHHLAVELVVERSGGAARCLGAYVLNLSSQEMETQAAGCTLLATGGMGQAYLHTTNPPIATGDGIAMAYRAGATVANMEFVQFHPTSLYQPQPDKSGRAFLISEAVRGEGGILRTREGRAFMADYHDRREMAPRDVVARAIDSELKASGDPCVYLDISSIGLARFRERFPNIVQGCAERGIELESQRIPVVPAAHYICGGVLTDLWGRTDIPSLYAAGETACTGVHGANRLASNSLLEALVFAHRAAKSALDEGKAPGSLPGWDYVGSVPSREKVVVSHNRQSIRSLMADYVGVVRSDERLRRAGQRLAVIEQEIRDYYWRYRVTEELAELRNISTVARLVIACATAREESRGLHFNQDHPKIEDPQCRKNSLMRREPGTP